MSPGSLWRVSVRIEPEAEEAVTEWLGRVCARPAFIEVNARSGAVMARVYLERLPGGAVRFRAALRPGLRRIAASGLRLGSGRITIRRVLRENWAESWKRHFKPIEIGPALLVKPGWHRRHAKPGQATVILDPGLSFGTGQHPTTRFCLTRLVAARIQDTGQSFLDIGTGSGILAISAAKLGYRPVEGFDSDPVAIRVARSNARRNRVRIRLTRRDLACLGATTPKRFDVVCANLTADLLLECRHVIRKYLNSNGMLIVSGILHSQFPEVSRAYEAAGLKLHSSRRVGDWESGAFTTA